MIISANASVTRSRPARLNRQPRRTLMRCVSRWSSLLVFAIAVAATSCVSALTHTDPARERLAIGAPDSFLVGFETSRGHFEVMARSNWAPVGVDRMYELLRQHYYDDVYFFRVV